MHTRFVGSLGLLVGIVAVCELGVTSLAQTGQSGAGPAAKVWTSAKTPDGQPDLQGMWLNFDSTPFETPAASRRGGGGGGAGGGGGGLFDDRRPVVARRKSLVVDPPDGRVPVLAWAEQKRDNDSAHIGDSFEFQTPWERCITRGVPGGIFPALYNNAYQIVQQPGYVAILYEMIHEARIIPLDGSPHLPENIRLWNGDSRGRWEGNTLVVDVTNFNDKGAITATNAAGRMRGIPQSDASHIVERFTRANENTINYEVTIDDPKVYSRPWKIAMPLTRDDSYQMYEYACHEGNYLTMGGTLSGGRAADEVEQTLKSKAR